MRVVWATDIHLNFLRPQERTAFFSSLHDSQPDAVFITGDIAEAHCLQELLHEIRQTMEVPLYFVLGNHDFYHGSIEAVRREVQDWCLTQPGLSYLSSSGLIELTPKTALIGHDGWGDGRFGNYEQSPVRAVLAKLQALGDESAAYLHEVLIKALESYEQIMCLTHVPPFKEACWYQGKMGNDDWLPYFACKAVGEVLLEITQDRPDCHVTVLCGHTHHAGTVQMLPNLYVKTGSAEYGQPHVEEILTIE
jgi:predicted MPP superfamily phosphohydrolase